MLASTQERLDEQSRKLGFLCCYAPILLIPKYYGLLTWPFRNKVISAMLSYFQAYFVVYAPSHRNFIGASLTTTGWTRSGS